MLTPAYVGHPVQYTVHGEHRTETVKKHPTTGEDLSYRGSVHHHEMTVFGGRIGRVHPDGTADIVIDVPHKEPKWIDGVKEGDGEHEFRLLRHVPEEEDEG